MLKYKTVEIDVPSGGSATETILTTSKGEKVSLKGAALDKSSGYLVSVSINGNYIAQVPAGTNTGYGKFFALNTEIDEPSEIKATIEDIGGGADTVRFTLMYED